MHAQAAPPGDGFTRNPNWIFDLMPALTPAQYKVLSAAVRLTYGWNSDWTDASAADVAEMTGVARPTVAAILNTFAAVGLITREPGSRNGYRWCLNPMTCADLSSKLTDHKATCQQSLQLPVILDDNYLSSKMTAYIRKKDRKDRKDRERTRGEKQAARESPATEQIATPDRPVRTPPPRAAPPPPPREVTQPRLVEADMPDPVDVYRTVAGVRKPNQAQRRAIVARVTGHADLWREVCDRFARNGWNVRAVDNLLDAYDKAVAERRRHDAAAAERERQARDREIVQLTDEERAENLRRLEEARRRLGFLQPPAARVAIGRPA